MSMESSHKGKKCGSVCVRACVCEETESQWLLNRQLAFLFFCGATAYFTALRLLFVCESVCKASL